jgi:hypothetical protein
MVLIFALVFTVGAVVVNGLVMARMNGLDD